MLSFKKILCPSDFSAASRAALTAAADLAASYKAELCLVHVIPVLPPAPPDPNFVLAVPEYERALHLDAERRLQALAQELCAKGISARTIIRHGDAGGEIVRAAAAETADLIVIATHGHTGWQHVMFGSVAEKVVRHARRPVLTIPAAQD